MNIAVLGSGAVSKRLLEHLSESGFNDEITVFSDHTDLVYCGDKEYRTQKYKELGAGYFDVVFGCLSKEKTEELFPYIKTRLMIDNSELFRLNSTIPLIVGDVNSHLISRDTTIVANPNCVVIMLSHLLIPLSQSFEIKKVICTTMQSVSGLGLGGINRLAEEESDNEFLEGEILPRFSFNGEAKTLYGNIVPLVGEIENNLSTHEENKISEELRKLISPNFEISSTCLRVPIKNGHTAVIHVTLNEPYDQTKLLRFIDLKTKLNYQEFLTLKDGIADKTRVSITRIKPDPHCPYAFFATLFSDNLSLGAAYNSFSVYRIYRRLNNVL